MSGLPDPVTRDQQFYRGVCDRIDTQNELLTQILDRLPAPPEERGDGTVELREPATSRAPAVQEPAEDEDPPADPPPGRRRPGRPRKSPKTSKEGA